MEKLSYDELAEISDTLLSWADYVKFRLKDYERAEKLLRIRKKIINFLRGDKNGTVGGTENKNLF